MSCSKQTGLVNFTMRNTADPRKSSRTDQRKGLGDRTGHRLIGGVIVAILGLTIVAPWGTDGVTLAPRAAFYAFFLLLGAALGGLRERLFVLFAVGVTAAALGLGIGEGVLLDAVARATFLVTFLLTLGMLREAAAVSPSVRACGRFLVLQPARRRYLALHAGALGASALLNFGTMNLLGTMIRQSVEGMPEAARGPVMQSMAAAVIRGFATMPLWGPATITMAVVVSVMPGLHWSEMVVPGLALAGLLTLYGVVLEAWREGGTVPAAAGEGRPPAVALPVLLFCLAGALLLGVAWVLTHGAGISLTHALMVAAPPFAVAWIMAQAARRGPAAMVLAGWAGLRGCVGGAVRSYREAIVLSASGFMGTLAAEMVPRDLLAAVAAGYDVAPLAVLAGATLGVAVAAQAAVNPLLTVVFCGSALYQLDSVQAAPVPVALALVLGWSLTLFASPFTAVALMMSRIMGVPATEIAWRWNLAYAVGTYVIGMLFIALWMAVG